MAKKLKMKLLVGDRFINRKGEECLLIYKDKEFVKLRVISPVSYFDIYPLNEFDALVERFIVVKLRRSPLNRENLPRHLGEFQLAIVGKKPIDMIMEDKKFQDYEIPKELYDAFKIYAIAMMKKVYKCNRKIAEENFYFFYHRFGLMIK